MTINIALMTPGGQRWIAGVIYIRNLMGALSLLPDKERPSFYLLSGVKGRGEYYKESGEPFPAVHYYAFRRDTPSWKKALSAILSMGKLIWPVSLEKLVVRRNISVIFPANFAVRHSFPIPRIGWIPDFQHKRLPDFFSAGELDERDRVFQQRISGSDHIVVSSRDAYRDLMIFFPTDPARVSILPFVSFPFPGWYGNTPAEITKQFNLPSKYLIFPSQFWRHKNHRVLFEAVRELRDTGCPDIALVCTGYTHDYRHPGYFRELQEWLSRHKLNRHIFIPGLLPRFRQIQLMREAAAVVQPSLFEGWSSIVEDAQALGKRIYLSDIPVHREQNPPDTVFFNPKDVKNLAETIQSDWAHLEPGPKLKQEEAAKIRQFKRSLNFAGDFINIVKKTGV